MEVHNISIDDNAADTSNEELEDEDHEALFKAFMERDEFCGGGVDSKGTHNARNSTNSMPFITNRKLLEQFRDWERPGNGHLDEFFYSSSVLQEQPDPFQFFLLDTVSTITAIKHPGIKLDPSMESLPLHNVIRLFGVTPLPKPSTLSQLDDGFVDDASEDFENYDKTNSISVCCNVHGFLSYFYALPIITNFNDVDEEEYWKSLEQEAFKKFLNDKIQEEILADISCIEYHEFVAENGQCVAKIEVVKSSDVDGIYHFFESKRERKASVFLKVFCTLPRFVWTAYSILSKQVFKQWKFECYEANINNTVRFLTDRNMTGCSWYEVKGQQYFLRNFAEPPVKESYCQIEIDVHFENIFRLDDDHSRYKFSPAVRILSFDIEVMVSPEDDFSPLDGRRQVIQIGAVLGNYYAGTNPKDAIIGKTIFVVGKCDKIEDAKVVQFYIQQHPDKTNEKYMEEAEAAMLVAWRDFIIQMDPDIITGYNIKKFDLPYLLDRSSVLSGFNHKSASILPFFSRMQKIKSQIRVIQNDLKKVNEFDEKNVNVSGRLILDLYPLLVRHERVRGGKGYFTLKSVAKRFLHKDEEKQDVHYKEIESLQHGTPADRSRMARYCLQDSMIPFLLLFEPVPCRSEIIRFIDLYFKKSHLGGTPLRYLFNKSMSYCEYFKQVRLQKNCTRVVYVPDTPSPRKKIVPVSPRLKYDLCKHQKTQENSDIIGETSKKISRNLFMD